MSLACLQQFMSKMPQTVQKFLKDLSPSGNTLEFPWPAEEVKAELWSAKIH